MDNNHCLQQLKKHPIIASLCDTELANDLCLSNVKMAVIMCGDLKTLPEIIKTVSDAGIYTLVYLDFIEGLSGRDGAVDFVKYYTCADGIVTTKSNQVRRAHSLNLFAEQRYFVFDLISEKMIKKSIDSSYADFVEILPGTIEQVVRYMSKGLNKPLIVGGFINTESDIKNALSWGAAGITTSIPDIWYL